MCSSSSQYALSILTGVVLCWTVLSSGCNSRSEKQIDQPTKAAEGRQVAVEKDHAHPNTPQGTQVAVREILAIVDKSLADLPLPPSAPAVCEDELAKAREVSKTAPGTKDAAEANSALLCCTSKAINITNCKAKPQPCGVVYYNPPIKRPDPGQHDPEPSELKAVDVSEPDQIAAACREIARAGGAALSTSDGADPATGVILGSMAGNYSCGAWFKAAASNDPTLLIGVGFVPSLQLIRDLKTYTNGAVDSTPKAVLQDTIKRVDYTLVTIRVGGAIVPVAVLPIVSVGGTPGQVLDGGHKTAQQRISQVGKAVGDDCKAAGICR